MKKLIGTISLLLTFILLAHAQDITWRDIKFKYRKGFVIVNNQNVFKLKYSVGYFYLSDLTTSEEVMFIYINDNGTPQYIEDDYNKVYFSESEKSFESKTHHRILMERLINEKVIDSNWKIDSTKIDKFINKYDENISGRTINIR